MKRSNHSEPLLVRVDQLTPDGHGHATHNGRDVAVFGALPGETVSATPVKKRGGWLFARGEEVHEASEERVTPFCLHSNRCAGCSMQHLRSDRQLAFKEQRLLQEFGDMTPGELMAPIVGPIEGYRSKARLGVKYVVNKGKVLVGFREKLGSYIAEIDTCGVLVDRIGSLLPRLAEVIGAMQSRSAIPQIEVAAGDRDAALVIRHLEELSDEDVEALVHLGLQENLQIYLQPGGPDTVKRAGSAGEKDLLFYELDEHDVVIGFHPLDFTQVNLHANRLMVSRAIELLEPSSQDHVIDLFCGIGNFTLPIARRSGQVEGLEGSLASVERAGENARLNGIDNAEFRCVDLYDADDDKGWITSDYNKAVIDPPRSGALEVCRALVRSRVERILYLSCNPVTLARDSRLLVDGGFRLEKAGVVDMFPHTSHVESMALFVR